MSPLSFLNFSKSRAQRRHKPSERAARLRSWRKLAVEPLEWRTLLAGDVAGTVLDDANNDGIKNNGENGIADVTVFVDLNLSGALDAGEPSAVTNKDGDYLIRSVAAGTKNIRQIVPPAMSPRPARRTTRTSWSRIAPRLRPTSSTTRVMSARYRVRCGRT